MPAKNMEQLPLEILNLITEELDEIKDILSLATASKALMTNFIEGVRVRHIPVPPPAFATSMWPLFYAVTVNLECYDPCTLPEVPILELNCSYIIPKENTVVIAEHVTELHLNDVSKWDELPLDLPTVTIVCPSGLRKLLGFYPDHVQISNMPVRLKFLSTYCCDNLLLSQDKYMIDTASLLVVKWANVADFFTKFVVEHCRYILYLHGYPMETIRIPYSPILEILGMQIREGIDYKDVYVTKHPISLIINYSILDYVNFTSVSLENPIPEVTVCDLLAQEPKSVRNRDVLGRYLPQQLPTALRDTLLEFIEDIHGATLDIVTLPPAEHLNLVCNVHRPLIVRYYCTSWYIVSPYIFLPDISINASDTSGNSGTSDKFSTLILLP